MGASRFWKRACGFVLLCPFWGLPDFFGTFHILLIIFLIGPSPLSEPIKTGPTRNISKGSGRLGRNCNLSRTTIKTNKQFGKFSHEGRLEPQVWVISGSSLGHFEWLRGGTLWLLGHFKLFHALVLLGHIHFSDLEAFITNQLSKPFLRVICAPSSERRLLAVRFSDTQTSSTEIDLLSRTIRANHSRFSCE